ncbi:MAG: ABC transporter substrate-binding protein [Ilumatobacteraceae bacterium]
MGISRREFCSLALISVAAAACSSDKASTDGTTATTAASTTTAGTTAETTAETTATTTADTAAGTTVGSSAAPETTAGSAAGDLDPTAVLRYAWVSPTSLDPHKSSISADLYVLSVFYDRLIHQSPDVELVPGLAESWTFADDGSYIELKLRKGVKFHDGADFDADVVKANIERGQTLEGSTVKGDLKIVTSVVVIDPLTVQLMLGGPAASFPTILSNQAGMMISPNALADPKLDQNPVGAGMYRATGYDPGVKLSLETWDGYWDPEAQLLGGIDISFISDFAARLNALRSDEMDVARIGPSQVADAEGADLGVLLQDSLEIGMLSFNRAKAPLDDVKVRQALNYAIDRQGIVDGLFFGLGSPSVQVFVEGLPGYSKDVPADTYAYDPDKARSLLAEAGHADGFDLVVNAAAIEFVITYAEAIQAQLGEIGVNVTINQVALADYGKVVYADANGDGTAVIGASRADASQTALQFQPGAFTNPGGASSPEVEALYNQSLDQTLSLDDRNKVLAELGKTLVDQAFALVIFHPRNPYGYNKRVVGLENWRNIIELRGVGILK